MAQGFHQNFEPQQAPAFFVRGPSPFARLVFFAAFSLVLMATDSRLQYLKSTREHLMAFVHPLQVLANTPADLYRTTNTYFSTHHYLLNENLHLKNQALKQAVALQQLQSLALENNNLRALFDTHQSLPQPSIMGEIMHEGRDFSNKKVVINRGTHHQVLAGSAVVDATGIIGQVTRAYPTSSEVTLITDKSLAIPIQIERNGLRAIAFGHGRDNTLDLPFLPANVDIQRGDKLVTSGIDGIYPTGLAVAMVKEVKITADSPFARIVCIPTGGIERHKHILIVSIPTEETNPTEPDTTITKPSTQHKTPALQEVTDAPVAIPKSSAQPTNPNLVSKPHATE
ncbi:MAG: rod shape-determining protein MreC [Methylotenera sp.]|nr:rod shape-determining protein MreC [Methylotenera sp.]